MNDASSLATALAQAPAGATIALDAGSYGAISINKNVTLIGRCAQKVVFKGSDLRGIYIVNNLKVHLQSLTVDGFGGGVVAAYGPSVSLSKVVIENSSIGLVVGQASADISNSVIVGQPATSPTATSASGGIEVSLGGKVTASDVEVRNSDGLNAYDDGTTVDLERSVLSYTGPDKAARLVDAFAGAKVTINESSLDARASGWLIGGRALPSIQYPTPPQPASIDVTASVFRQSGANEHRGLATLTDGARASFTGTTLHHQSYTALQVGNGASATLVDSAITTEPVYDTYRSALFVTQAGSATLTGVAIVDAYQNALLVGHPGSSLKLSKSLVLGTEFRGPGPEAQLGGAALAVGAGDGAQLDVTDSTISATPQYALYGESKSHIQVSGSLIDQTTEAPQKAGGDGVVLIDDSQLSMKNSMVRSSSESGMAVANATAKVEGTAFVENAAVLQLNGATLSQTPADQAAPRQVLFLDNRLFKNDKFQRTGTSPLIAAGLP